MTATISDHLPQFVIFLNMFDNISSNKFDRENFILGYFSVDWDSLLKTDELKTDSAIKMYLDKINMLDIYAPLRTISK